MEPTNFKEQNTVFAKNQEQYKPLPAYKANTPTGEVVTCWRLSFVERLRILFTGRLWACLLTFNGPLAPSFFSTKKSEVLDESFFKAKADNV